MNTLEEVALLKGLMKTYLLQEAPSYEFARRVLLSPNIVEINPQKILMQMGQVIQKAILKNRQKP